MKNTKERKFRETMGLKLNVDICAKWQENLVWSISVICLLSAVLHAIPFSYSYGL